MTQRDRNEVGSSAAWEERARALLGESGRDQDLGVRSARDAREVIAGRLDEEEFRRRHHEGYLREFGTDERPGLSDATADDPQAPDPERAAVVVSRRAALRLLGSGAGAVLFLGEALRRSSSALAQLDGKRVAEGARPASAAGAKQVRMGMVVDLTLCDGCLTCVRACYDENGLSDGVFWGYVIGFQEEGDEQPTFLLRTCQHCSRAPCVLVCPTGARHRRKQDGLVLSDYNRCIGCRYCMAACPYGANYFQWGDPKSYGGRFQGNRLDSDGRAVIGDPPKGVMGKCNWCPQRLDQKAMNTTACAEACPMDVLHFGDFNDPESAPNRYLAERRRANGGRLPTFRLLEDLGTEPNVIFIGTPPSRRAQLVEPPISYQQKGFLEDRRKVLEGPKPWFLRMLGGKG